MLVGTSTLFLTAAARQGKGWKIKVVLLDENILKPFFFYIFIKIVSRNRWFKEYIYSFPPKKKK